MGDFLWNQCIEKVVFLQMRPSKRFRNSWHTTGSVHTDLVLRLELYQNFAFSILIFCGNLTCFFLIFFLFFRPGLSAFRIQFLVIGIVLRLVNENSLNFLRGLVMLCVFRFLILLLVLHLFTQQS